MWLVTSPHGLSKMHVLLHADCIDVSSNNTLILFDSVHVCLFLSHCQYIYCMFLRKQITYFLSAEEIELKKQKPLPV